MIDLTSLPEKLSASILNKAIQGKLTEQLPEDGNANVILKEVNDEKKQLIKEKKIKQAKKSYDIITDDKIPFNIPKNWQWVKLTDISTFPQTKSINASDITDSTWVLDLKEIEKNTGKLLSKKFKYEKKSKSNKIIFHKNDVLYNKLRPYLNKVLVAQDNGVATSEIYVIHLLGKIIPSYISIVLRSPYFLKMVNNDTYGTKMPRAGTKNMIKYLIPLPPLSEQKRIVDKLDSIIPKVQKFNVLVNELHQLRNNFPKRLKASLLKSAMQGKLTKQLPEDGNAVDLLKQINDEKQKLIDNKKIRNHKALPDITSEEIPFNIPNNWRWVRLRNISSYIQRGKSPKYGNDGIKVLSQKCVQWSGIDISKARRIRKESLKKYDKIRYLQNHDILWNSTGDGTLGRVSEILSDNINNDDILVVDSHVTVIRTLSNISHFVLMYLSSPYIQNNLNQLSSGSTKQIELSKKSIENVVIPLPPLKEQKRIVSKLDHLFKVLNLD